MASRGSRRGSASLEKVLLLAIVLSTAAGLFYLGARALAALVRFTVELLTGPLL